MAQLKDPPREATT